MCKGVKGVLWIAGYQRGRELAGLGALRGGRDGGGEIVMDGGLRYILSVSFAVFGFLFPFYLLS